MSLLEYLNWKTVALEILPSVYDGNSTLKFNIIKRHETELKWIKLLETPFPPGLNDNIYHEDTTFVFRKCLILMSSLFWNVGGVKLDLMI